MKKLAQRLLFLTATVAASSAMAGVTFYEGEGFAGQPLRIDGVAADFRQFNFNDVPRSMVVEGSPVEVCIDINFSGNCQVFNPGTYPTLGPWAGQISSVRPANSQYGRYQRRDDRGSGYYQDGRWSQERPSGNYQDGRWGQERPSGYYQDGRWGQDRWNEPRYRGGY